MFRVGPRSTFLPVASLLVLVAVLAGGLLVGRPAAAADGEIWKCSKRLAKGVKQFTTDIAASVGDCELNDLKDENASVACLAGEDFNKDLDGAADKLSREVTKCGADIFEAICPLDARTAGSFRAGIESGQGALSMVVGGTIVDLFETSIDETCPRPTGEVSSEAVDCADSATRLFEDALDEFQKCLYKCELSSLRSSTRTPCIDDATQLPVIEQEKLEECRAATFADLMEGLSRRCLSGDEEIGDEAVLLRELGCPLGQASVAGVGATLWERMYALVVGLDLGIFRSQCQSNVPGVPIVTPPARVRLLPSTIERDVNCGDRLGPTFFGADDTLEFLTDLDCSAATVPAGGGAVDGIQIARSGVTVSGRSTQSLTGPSRSSARTGAAIRIVAGTIAVKIKNFKAIQNFGIGIKDGGDNTGLRIDDLTLRRNSMAGVDLRSPGAQLEGVKADRNGVGYILSGDGTTLRESRALRSSSPDGVGVLLSGSDLDNDGRVVRVTSSEIGENQVGIRITAGPQFIEDNAIEDNLGAGIEADGTGGKLESNNVRRNGGAGIAIGGIGVHATANRAEENGGSGFVVTGANAILDNNVSGVLSDKGNGAHGFVIRAPGAVLETNVSEACAGDGFRLEAVADLIHGNTANSAVGVGFRVMAAGNGLDTNVAQSSGGAEFDLVAGTIDLAGNRANGQTFSFSLTGGIFE